MIIRLSRKYIIIFLFFLIFGIPLTIFLGYLGMNYSGFCFARMRYVTAEEKLKLVFDYQNARRFLPLEHDLVEHIKYESFSKYIQLYPNCCSVNPGGPYDIPPTSLIERVFGYDSGDVVVIDFNVKYSDDSGRQHVEQVQFENFLTNCGDVR
jgi:hypothetical protein